MNKNLNTYIKLKLQETTFKKYKPNTRLIMRQFKMIYQSMPFIILIALMSFKSKNPQASAKCYENMDYGYEVYVEFLEANKVSGYLHILGDADYHFHGTHEGSTLKLTFDDPWNGQANETWSLSGNQLKSPDSEITVTETTCQ